MLRILFLFISLITINTLYGQEAKLTKPQEVNSNQVKAPLYKQPTVIENSATKTYLVKDEEYYNKFIAALKGKKEHMQNDPALNEKAKSLNWYTKIDSEIEKAEEQLKKLKEK